jgi:hypothetical protein
MEEIMRNTKKFLKSNENKKRKLPDPVGYSKGCECLYKNNREISNK